MSVAAIEIGGLFDGKPIFAGPSPCTLVQGYWP